MQRGGLLFAVLTAALVACVQGSSEETGATEAAAAAPVVTDADVTTALGGRLRPLGPGQARDPAKVLLGKALFWDVQAGGDGQTACASCHYHAGADTRSAFAPGPDGLVTSLPGKNITSDDRVGSPGVAVSRWDGQACVASKSARQTTGRNAPTAIGANVYRELFYDGRASSLAAQARGPILNAVEMSCAGRTFEDVARTLLPLRPLARQTIDRDDSVLGALPTGATYRSLVDAAYGPDVSFEEVWGDAIAAYEETLVPNETPLDRYLAGDVKALSNDEKWGLVLFATRGRCIECHDGAALTDATQEYFDAHGPLNVDHGDQGYHNIGVRPVIGYEPEDVGREAHSVSQSFVDRGAFKTPALRNVKLTAPYFHNGGKQTLTDVVSFYRGPIWGDYPHTSTAVRAIQLTPVEVAPIVSLLEHGLTDCRVENERAPFDHPSLVVPDGPTLGAVGRDGHGTCP